MSVVALLAAHTGLVHDVDFPPLPAELLGAAVAAVASWVGWLFARADRTSDRRVEALEAATKSLTVRVATLEKSREKAEAARDLAEEEAHRLRVQVFRLEEYAAGLIRWGLSLIRMIAPELRPPAPPSAPSGFEDVGDLCGGGVPAGPFPGDSGSGHVPGDTAPGDGDSGS
nr:MAG TPA: hypothetical protein [Caudoviricetes sp.]